MVAADHTRPPSPLGAKRGDQLGRVDLEGAAWIWRDVAAVDDGIDPVRRAEEQAADLVPR